MIYEAFSLGFYIILVGMFFALVGVWDEDDRESWIKLSLVFFLLALFPLLVSVSAYVPTVNLCDHYEVVEGKKVCVPIKKFSLPAPYLTRTELKSPSGIIYSEDGKRIGKVHLRVVKEKVGSEDPKLIVELTKSVGRKMVETVERGEDEFYLDILTGGKLWKAVKFEVEEYVRGVR